MRAPLDDKGNAAPGDLVRQANVYGDIVTACLSHPGCEAIQLWGFAGKSSWVGSHTNHRAGAALPFDEHDQPKAGYEVFPEVPERGR